MTIPPLSKSDLEITHNLPIVLSPFTAPINLIFHQSPTFRLSALAPTPAPTPAPAPAPTSISSPKQASDLPILPHPIADLHHPSSSSSSLSSSTSTSLSLSPSTSSSWSSDPIDHQLNPISPKGSEGCLIDLEDQQQSDALSIISPTSRLHLPSLDPNHRTLRPISPILRTATDPNHPTNNHRSPPRNRNVRFSDPTPLAILQSIDHPHSTNQWLWTSTPTPAEPRSRRLGHHSNANQTEIMADRAYEKLDPFPSPSPSLRFLSTIDSDSSDSPSIHRVSLPDWVIQEYLKTSSLRHHGSPSQPTPSNRLNSPKHHYRWSTPIRGTGDDDQPNHGGIKYQKLPKLDTHHHDSSSSKVDGHPQHKLHCNSNSPTIPQLQQTRFCIPSLSPRSSPLGLKLNNKNSVRPSCVLGMVKDHDHRCCEPTPNSRIAIRPRPKPRSGRVLYKILDESEVIQSNQYHHYHPPPAPSPQSPPPPASRRSSTSISTTPHPTNYLPICSSSPPPAVHPLPHPPHPYPYLVRPDPRTTRSKLDHLLVSIFKKNKNKNKN